MSDSGGEVGIVEIAAIVMMSALFSVGGGNGQVALMQDQWVSQGVIAPALFAWAFAIGHFVPGPKVSFIVAVGYYLAGIPGAVTALVAISIPTSIGASLASHWYLRFRDLINRLTLAGSFVIAGMMSTAAISLGLPMEVTIIGLSVIVIVTAVFSLRGIDPVFIISGTAALGVALWWLGNT
jgi:chromate transporter